MNGSQGQRIRHSRIVLPVNDTPVVNGDHVEVLNYRKGFSGQEENGPRKGLDNASKVSTQKGVDSSLYETL